MNEVKKAFVEALDACADASEKVVGEQKLAEDVQEGSAQLSHADFIAKWEAASAPEHLRHWARRLRRADVEQGDWPRFRPRDAADAMETIEQIRDGAAARSQNEIFLTSVDRSLPILRGVITKYASLRLIRTSSTRNECR